MPLKTIKDLDLKEKRVLLRADLNVPTQDGQVTDTTRIDSLKPTIDYLVRAGAKVLVLSHFGRPDGAYTPQMSLAFLVGILEQRWQVPVAFAQDCIGPRAEIAVQALQPEQVLLLENVRFHKGEKKNDPAFCQAIAAMGDVFIHDAFSAAHRAHASTYGLADYLPAAAGLLMAREIEALERALGSPEKPVMAIVGGSKISTKLNVLENLVQKVDYLVLGGGMANTFLHARGGDIGASLCEPDMAVDAQNIMQRAADHGCALVLPRDVTVVTALKTGAASEVVPAHAIPADMMAVDIGPDSIRHVTGLLETCRTVVWNGPMGVFEIRPFDTGTNALAQTVAALTEEGRIQSIAGGGDTVAALRNAGVESAFSYLSMAGGAFLEWLEGKTLPGVQILMNDAPS